MVDMDEKVLALVGGAATAPTPILVHPNYVLRVAGESASKLSAIWTGKADEAWRGLVDMRERAASLSADVCDRLARVVSLILDDADRRQVLDLRRALHNGRPAKAAGLETVRGKPLFDLER